MNGSIETPSPNRENKIQTRSFDSPHRNVSKVASYPRWIPMSSREGFPWLTEGNLKHPSFFWANHAAILGIPPQRSSRLQSLVKSICFVRDKSGNWAPQKWIVVLFEQPEKGLVENIDLTCTLSRYLPETLGDIETPKQKNLQQSLAVPPHPWSSLNRARPLNTRANSKRMDINQRSPGCCWLKGKPRFRKHTWGSLIGYVSLGTLVVGFGGSLKIPLPTQAILNSAC